MGPEELLWGSHGDGGKGGGRARSRYGRTQRRKEMNDRINRPAEKERTFGNFSISIKSETLILSRSLFRTLSLPFVARSSLTARCAKFCKHQQETPRKSTSNCLRCGFQW